MTGAGKTTMIDSLINFLLGVNFYDKFRYKLIDEREIQKKTGGQTKSQTHKATTYHIPNDWIQNRQSRFRDDRYCINIIDTPGYGDTSGPQRDAFIFAQITNTFKIIEHLDYVFLVNKATDNRLAASLKFVYEQIQNMFAKDTIDRFIVMCTFSDGKDPLAKQAIEKSNFKIEKYFKFNNSPIFWLYFWFEFLFRFPTRLTLLI